MYKIMNQWISNFYLYGLGLIKFKIFAICKQIPQLNFTISFIFKIAAHNAIGNVFLLLQLHFSSTN